MNFPYHTDAVHPRACGEHSGDCFAWASEDGSSPRVRGTLTVGDPPVGCTRFIPARAGNTVDTQNGALGIPVHPRACGEHIDYTVVEGSVIGSSPRVRGTPNHKPQVGSYSRFIPARAGNTDQNKFSV